MTDSAEAIYLEVSEKTEAARKQNRRVSVSGMLKYLGVSRSGYRSWLNRTPSDTEKRREYVKARIQDIYHQSKQNYGAPKIAGSYVRRERPSQNVPLEIYEGNGG